MKRLRTMRRLRYLMALVWFAAVVCLVVGISSYVSSARPAAPAPAVGTATSPAPSPTRPAPTPEKVPSPADNVATAPGTLALDLTCGGVNFSGEAVISTSVSYRLSGGGSGSHAVGPGPFNFDVMWTATIQGLQGPFVASVTGTLDLSQAQAPNVTVSLTRTLRCAGRG